MRRSKLRCLSVQFRTGFGLLCANLLHASRFIGPNSADDTVCAGRVSCQGRARQGLHQHTPADWL